MNDAKCDVPFVYKHRLFHWDTLIIIPEKII